MLKPNDVIAKHIDSNVLGAPSQSDNNSSSSSEKLQAKLQAEVQPQILAKPKAEVQSQVQSQVQAVTNAERPSYALIEATARQLREDLRVDKWFGDIRSGDAEKVKQTLSALPRDQETMARLQRAYAADKKNPHANLVKDIEAHLSKADAENLKVTIENPDSKFARLDTAAVRIKEAQGNSSEITAATRDLRQQLSVLNSAEINAANQESLAKNGKSLAQTFLAIPNLRQADKTAIHILLKGSDERAKLPQLNAQIAVEAVKAKDLDMLREGLGNSPEARQIFSERGQVKLLAAAFSGKDLKIAQDIAAHGETQISSLVEFNKGLFGCDKEGVIQAIKTLSSEQSKSLIRGHELTNLKASPANATKADIEAVEAYRTFKQAIDANFSKADAEELKALALKTSVAAKTSETAKTGGSASTRAPERTYINEQISQLRAAIVSDKSLTRAEIDDVKETLGSVKPQDRGTLHDLYAERYGDNLTDILAKIPKEEQASVAALLQNSQQNRAEQIELLALQRKNSESGLLGTVDFADRYTAIQNNDTFRKASETASAKFQNVAAEKEQQLFSNASETYSQWQNEKADKANLITDGAIIGGSLLLSGGLSAPVVLGAAAVGGSIKVVGSKTLIGDSYGSTEQVAVDFSRGSLNTVFNTIGPAQAARFLKLGSNVSRETGEVVIAKSAEELGKQAVFKKVATEQGLIFGSAYVGGAGSGTVESLARWDKAKSNEDNIKHTFKVANETGIASGIGALALSGLIHTGSRFFKSSENSLNYYSGKAGAGTKVEGGIGADTEIRLEPEIVAAAAPSAASSRTIDRLTIDEAAELRSPKKDFVPELERTSELPEKSITRTRTADGKVTYVDSAYHRTTTFDQHGRLIHAKEGNIERRFRYSLDGKLKAIIEDNLIASREGKGSWVIRNTDVDGKVTREQWFDGTVSVSKTGSVNFKSKEQYPITAKVDGTHYEVRLGRNEYLFANLDYQNSLLEKLARKSFPDEARFKRFSQLLNEFEQSRLTRGISDHRKALFTVHLNRLLKPNRTAVLSQTERADLAEQVLWHAAHPNTVDQGSFSTCSVATLEVRNYARDPERNAQLIADIATNGKFVTVDGITVDMTRLDFGLRPDNEALRARRLQRRGNSDALKEDGSRDWSSQIIQTALVNTHWQGRRHFVLDGQIIDDWNVVYDSEGKVAVNIGESFGGKTPLEAGKATEKLERSRIVLNEQGEFHLVNDQSKLVKIYDHAGNRLEHLNAGTDGYDAEGKWIFRATKPGNGEIKYDITTSKAFMTEGVFFDNGYEWLPLAGDDGFVLNQPRIYSKDIEALNRLATGLTDSGYVITTGRKSFLDDELISVSSAKELGKLILKLQNDGNLPAILRVHTANEPFSEISESVSAAGDDGIAHVINVHGIDPETGLVPITDQSGPKNDRLGGVPIDELYKATKKPRK
jgi:hypothetical protein